MDSLGPAGFGRWPDLLGGRQRPAPLLEDSKTFRAVSRNPWGDGEEVQASAAIPQGFFLIRTRKTLWALRK